MLRGLLIAVIAVSALNAENWNEAPKHNKCANKLISTEVTIVLQEPTPNADPQILKNVLATLSEIVRIFFKEQYTVFTRVALVTFRTTSHIKLHYNMPESIDYNSIINIINDQVNSQHEEWDSDISSALLTVTRDLVPQTRQVDIPHLVLVVSDGNTTTDVTEQANLLKSTGAKVYSIAVEPIISRTVLEKIASKLSNVILLSDPRDVESIVNEELMSLCEPPIIPSTTFSTPKSSLGGACHWCFFRTQKCCTCQPGFTGRFCHKKIKKNISKRKQNWMF